MARFKACALLSLLSKIIRPKVGIIKAPRIATTARALEHQRSSQIVQIPDDVLLIIIDYLSLTDRACLLQTCRYFHSLLEETQYHHINILSHIRSDRLHRTLSKRPDLIPCIMSYRGPLTPILISTRRVRKKKNRIQLRLPKSTAPPVTKTKSFRRVIYIFTHAVNLRGLEFTDFNDWASNPIWEPVRRSVSKMPLTRLVLLTKSVEVVSLLRALPGLESLELLWLSRTRLDALKESDIPELRSLKATLEDAAKLIPGRPVEEFHHLLGAGGFLLDEKLFRNLSLSRSQITKLTTGLLDPWDHESVRRTLQLFARHLPEIHHLTITVNGTIPGQILLDEIPSFKLLRSVRFLGANLDHMVDSDNGTGSGLVFQTPMVNDWNILVPRLQAQCPSLVDIEHTSGQFCRPL